MSHVKGAAEEHEVAEEGTEVEAGDPVLRRRILGRLTPVEVRQAFEAAAKEAKTFLPAD
ncbi:hypothetical protein [Mesorhizobium sp. M0203]|uniref:hypothetical protein n=1 Tax=Mesorhizobium sp. M0203 TaxID=2956912 RepID=UPI003338ED9D